MNETRTIIVMMIIYQDSKLVLSNPFIIYEVFLIYETLYKRVPYHHL